MNSTKIKKYFTNVKIIKGHITQHTDNSIVIFDTKKSILHTLNNTAMYIFDKLKKGANIEKIVLDFSKDFGVSEKKAEQDITEFIDMLITKKLAVRKKSLK